MKGSGHAAGYQWAQEKGITDETELPERAGSFRDGAAAYLAEQKKDESDSSGDKWGY